VDDPISSSPKDEYLGQIWAVISTFTNEAFAAAKKKCIELGFEPNRGIVPLQESFVNLGSAQAILEDAIEKQKLIQLPITVQKELLANVESIAKFLQGLISGADEVANLTGAIETLNASIWKYGLHNLSNEVLGYQKKLNQIKNQELEIARAIEELRAAQEIAKTTISASTEVQAQAVAVAKTLEAVKTTNDSATEVLKQLNEVGTKSGALYATIQQQETQSGLLAATIKTANNELVAMDASIRKFYGDVGEYRNKIDQATKDAEAVVKNSESRLNEHLIEATNKIDAASTELTKAQGEAIRSLTSKVESATTGAETALAKSNADLKASSSKLLLETESQLKNAIQNVSESTSKLIGEAESQLDLAQQQLDTRSAETISENEKKTAHLVEGLDKLKEQIKEQIQQATGFALFGAFQSRQNEISKAKAYWVWAIGILVVLSAGVTAWIAHEAQGYAANSFAFWIKLSLTVPLAFAITFCTVQYSRERRLEEEYAFKSSISVSLNPYRDLIQSILKNEPGEQSKYADFVIEAVRNVFTPPTDKVFDVQQKEGLTAKTFKQTAEILGTAVKAAK
jgi:hypothetical protein